MRVFSRRSILASMAASVVVAQTVRQKEHPVPELPFHTRLEVTAKVLLLHYAVENRGSRDAYLLNRVHDQSLQTSPDLVYIELAHEQRVVRAYKNIPPIPPGMSPTMPAAPYVTPVRAGQSFRETVRMAVPVREYSAYAAVPEHGRTVQYAGLAFVLGFYWSVPGMKEHTQEIVPGVEVIIPIPPPGMGIEFGELSSGVMPGDFPVVETSR
jgi:hypothetical protein